MINTEFMRNNILTFGLELVSERAILELLDHLEAVESECLEQARLNGMGSEREAALMAKLEAAEKERDAARKCADMLALALDTSNHERDALYAKVETAENDAAHQKALADSALRVAEGWERKCGELRAALQHETDCVEAAKAEIAEMEQQEPFDADSDVFRNAFVAALKAGNWPATRQGDGYRSPSTQIAWRIAFSTVNRLKLYLAPGAKGE